MRLIPIEQCQPGARLARTIFSDTGATLLAKGVILTESILERLGKLQIPFLYIEDQYTNSMVPDVEISEETRRQALELIQRTFQTVLDQPDQLITLFSDEQLGSRIKEVMSNLIKELLQNRSAMNLLGTSCAIDHYLFSHSFQVTLYALAVSTRLGLTNQELMKIGIGAMLHDVGKMLIPVTILQKPGMLTDAEFDIMKRHAELGFALLQNSDSNDPLLQFAAECALSHHERCDGSGYPRGLKQEQIDPMVRILSVCDVFDALSSHRVYRRAMLPHVAMEILFGGVGKHFDQRIVEAFRDTIALYPLGLFVTLNTGESGVVIGYNQGMPSRPIIRIEQSAQGEMLASPYEVDLSRQLNLVISSSEPIPRVITNLSF
ncbi:MAG: HD-GYP domain-containing protein [Clostridia bacterium]